MITLRHILAGLGAPAADVWLLSRVFAHLVQDSREVQPGDLFVARRGETMDGHAFVADAVKRGAAAVLAERIVDAPKPLWVVDCRQGAALVSGLPDAGSVVYILVGDSDQALEQITIWWRAQLAVDVMGVTGSVGKTTTKELIAAVLSRRYSVLKSERSLNTTTGMEFTLLGLEPEHEKAVLEMGMYTTGEIAHLCRLARPRCGVVTNVGPVHLERLGSIEAIAAAKSELVQALPANGVALLNGDDRLVRAMADKTQAHVFTFGLTPGLDLWASDVESRGLDGIDFRLHYGGESRAIHAALLGRHSVQTALAAAAAGLVMGLTWNEIAAGMSSVPQQLRLVVVAAANGATLVDDTYNSSPVSCLAALDLLAELGGRHVAVLGDMLELGVYEDEGHRLVGQRVARVAQALVAVGRRGRLIGEAALRQGMPGDQVFFASRNAEAVEILRRLTQAGDYVLLKGSRGMKMEEIVRALR